MSRATATVPVRVFTYIKENVKAHCKLNFLARSVQMMSRSYKPLPSHLRSFVKCDFVKRKVARKLKLFSAETLTTRSDYVARHDRELIACRIPQSLRELHANWSWVAYARGYGDITDINHAYYQSPTRDRACSSFISVRDYKRVLILKLSRIINSIYIVCFRLFWLSEREYREEVESNSIYKQHSELAVNELSISWKSYICAFTVYLCH